MNIRKLPSLVTSGALVFGLFASSTAHAAEANGLGGQTQLIVSADRLMPILSHTRSSVTAHQGGAELTTTDAVTTSSLLWGGNLHAAYLHTTPRVGLDVAIGHTRLTLGGWATFAFTLGGSRTSEAQRNGALIETKGDAPSNTLFGIGPRIGYILPLGDVLGLWLRGGISFYSFSSKTIEGPAEHNKDSITQFSLDLDPQLTIVPFEHFFLAVGPLVNVPFGGTITQERVRNNVTTKVDNDYSLFQIGANASLGGWFNL